MRPRVLALAMLLAASGCSGGDGRSKEDFIADADAVCAAANPQLGRLGALRPSLFIESHRRHGLERWFSGFVETLERSNAELDALERPAGERDALEAALFEPREEVLAHAIETLLLVRLNGTPVPSSRRVELRRLMSSARGWATGYGLEDCAAIGR